MRHMRRLAAALAFLSLSQSAMLSTGIVCERGERHSAGMVPMPGVTDGDAQGDVRGPESRPSSGHDRHHNGAHCPLMASCAVVAVSAPSLEIGVLQHPTTSLRIARTIAPNSEKAAPEPPPPKN
jgi:hypothetical protein